MPVINLRTIINSDIETCFDLSRSIDLHIISTAHTKERAIDGKVSGLIGPGEFVTWQAIHFGITQQLTSKITEYDRPFHFRDEQVKGAFNYLFHDHNFEVVDGKLIMEDIFNFRSPWSLIGRLVDKFILINYLTKLLIRRNALIKEYAETEKWKEIL